MSLEERENQPETVSVGRMPWEMMDFEGRFGSREPVRSHKAAEVTVPGTMRDMHALLEATALIENPERMIRQQEKAFCDLLERFATPASGRAFALARTKMAEARMWAIEGLS